MYFFTFVSTDNSMKNLYKILLALLIVSCSSQGEKVSYTYFGGKIINPKTDFVLLLKDDIILDTLKLDAENHFLGNYEKLEEGLYTFKHGIEFQYIYIQPKDSIILRLNTWDFDESLVFNGTGGSKNEYLLKLFLQNEREEKAMYKLFKEEENIFLNELYIIEKDRLATFEAFKEVTPELSEGFIKLTEYAIKLPIERMKEVYPFYYKREHNMNHFPSLSASYYDFRAEISLNEHNYIAFYPYQNYIMSRMYNAAYQDKEMDSSKDNITVNILNNIESTVPMEDLKNTMLKRVVVNEFLKAETFCHLQEAALNTFLDHCTNDTFKSEVKDLVHDSQVVEVDRPLKDFDLLSYDAEPNTIRRITRGDDAVIYFWSTEFMASQSLVKRIQYLENKFPQVSFIGVHMNTSSDNLKSDPNLKQLDHSKQFVLPEDSYAHNLLHSNYPRAIVINDEGIVRSGFININSSALNDLLKKLN